MDAKISKLLPRAQRQDKLLVAAYCRVSTGDPAQEASLEAQRRHWEECIAARSGWILAGVYADDGLSGTHAGTRPELMRLIADCAQGKIHFILTKSVSRFSRNTADCLRLIRSLQSLGVGILFEKESIDTSSMASEFLLSIMASLAAEESRSLSQNVKIGYRHRFLAGDFYYKRPPYGYTAENGFLVLCKEEAGIVREIFHAALSGRSPSRIASDLNARAIQTKYHASWAANTVLAILSNITYTGDALLQKTWRDDCFASRINRGEQDRYYVPEHHEGIVSREVFVLASQILGFSNPYARIKAIEEAEAEGGRTAEGSPAPGRKRVLIIKAAPGGTGSGRSTGKMRVAAYCRVSTDLEEQESSYAAQCSHYHALITGNKNWMLAGIYADDGISGTSMRRREAFNKMLADAEQGKIDLILTKSISRFARNTLDCLSAVRKLKSLGVGVSFEKEGLDTLDKSGEVILTILASIAQQESASISQNVRIGIQYRFQQGHPMVNCKRFLGYDRDRNGRLVINPAQARVVRRIYRDFLDGFSVEMIAMDLQREGVSSGTGSKSWPPSSVRYILLNEKYAGDLLLQKTLVEDFLTHKLVKNKGQLPQYYVDSAHAPILPKSVYTRAGDELWLRGSTCPAGGTRFGSRKALMGRIYCACGQRMRRLRRKTPLWLCGSCGSRAEEALLKARVMAAVLRLPAYASQIEAEIRRLAGDLQSPERERRVKAQRKDWQLRNLLELHRPCPPAYAGKPACREEEDFRMRTKKQALCREEDGQAWDDDMLIRILERVEIRSGGAAQYPSDTVCRVIFKGGLCVDAASDPPGKVLPGLPCL